jgi:hypothetical protein
MNWVGQFLYGRIFTNPNQDPIRFYHLGEQVFAGKTYRGMVHADVLINEHAAFLLDDLSVV